MTSTYERMAAVDTAARELDHALKAALEALEQAGTSARDADEFIRDAVFNAWWDWDYEPTASNQESRPEAE